MMQIINHIKDRLGQSKTFISKMDNKFFTFPDALTLSRPEIFLSPIRLKVKIIDLDDK